MRLNLNVFDARGRQRGRAQVQLIWGQNKWVLRSDTRNVWRHVGFSRRGSFRRKDWDVIWFWDQARAGDKHNTIVLWDPPSGNMDRRHIHGSARIYDPKDSAFRKGRIEWNAELPAMPDVLSSNRRKVLRWMRQYIPCTYNSESFKKLTGGLTKDNPEVKRVEKAGRTYTTCGSLPGFVSAQLLRHLSKGKKSHPKSLNGTNILPIRGRKHGAWIVADKKKRPLPGDLYALCSGSTPNDSIQHVGVIIHSVGKYWKTADLGQGNGWSGQFVIREYDEERGTLTGEAIGKGNKRPPRVLAGWVDLDKYFGNQFSSI